MSGDDDDHKIRDEVRSEVAQNAIEFGADTWWDGACCGCDCNPFLLGSVLAAVALRAPSRPPRGRPSVPARGGRLLIRGYQRWLSARLPTRCRHTPTCSSYGLEAVGRYGLWQGSRLTAGRITRCTRQVPRGTADPVP